MCTAVRFIKRAACLLLAEVHTRSAMMADATSELQGPQASRPPPSVHAFILSTAQSERNIANCALCLSVRISAGFVALG